MTPQTKTLNVLMVTPRYFPYMGGIETHVHEVGRRLAGSEVKNYQGCHTFVPPLAMLAAKKAKLPYIVTFHTGGHSSHFRSGIRDIQWKLFRPLFAGASKLMHQMEKPLVPAQISLPTWEDCAQKLQNIYSMFARRELCAS